ncbi:MAG: serine aminopeptidase domain-containing protein [Acidimicrobiales bacterium]
MMDSVTTAGSATATWFGPIERPLFGWVHAPGDGWSAGAVVLCPPLAREQTSAHFTYRVLAESLAERGLAVLRFDYDGTGDSAGGDEDPDRVEAWMGSIADAVAHVRRAGAPSVALVGMRMGGLLAASVARRLGDLDALVLWDPCWSGHAFLRYQQALSMLRFGPQRCPGGGVELPGYLYSALTVDQISALRMPPGGERFAKRVLVLTRPDSPRPAQFTPGLSHGDVDWEEAQGQAELLDVEASMHKVPESTIARITRWLAEAVAEDRYRPAWSSQAEARLAGPSPVVERLVRLGPIGLFGIETSPVTRSLGPTILFLNSGKDWHVGPNRMWTLLARHWAASGFRTVRFDLSGLGDSPVRAGGSFQSMFSPDAFDDLADATAAVSPDDPTDVIFVGLCSGAYQSLESAIVMAPRGVVAINPALSFVPPETTFGAVDPRRRICQPANRAVHLYHSLPFPSLRAKLLPLAWWGANLLAGEGAPVKWLGDLAAKDVETLIVSGVDGARPFTDGRDRTRASDPTTGRVRVEVIEGLDHVLLRSADRTLVTRLVTAHLLDCFGAQSIGEERFGARDLLLDVMVEAVHGEPEGDGVRLAG